jgi:hypothetical protein
LSYILCSLLSYRYNHPLMKRYTIFGMTIVLLIAAALRLGALPDLPVGLHYDEAANVILTRQIVAGDYRPVFIRAYTGKEVLFFYAAAPWVWMTGGAPWGLRLGAAMLGVLTVAATFAATRALFGPAKGSRTVALLAAGWVAVAFSHVLLSRYGFRAIAQPLLQALTVAALWRGLRSGKCVWLIAGGACLGLTGYTYLAARLFPIPLTMALGWLLIRTRREDRPRRVAQVGLALLVAVVAFAPLGLYFLRNPEAFTTRITQVAAPTWQDALRGLWLCARALVWPGAGDPYIRFNVPGKPVLDALSALLALFGLAALPFAARKSPLDGAARLFIVAVLATMLLPSALATSEITPSNLRMIGLFPFITILPAYGAVVIIAALTRGDLTNRPTDLKRRLLLPAPCFLLPAACLLLLLLLGGPATGRAYRGWAASPELFYAADGEMTLAAAALDATDRSDATVYIASEHYRHPTLAALAQRYGQAKWLTGGATLVLPPSGSAVYLWPHSLTPAAPWPETLAGKGQTVARNDPCRRTGALGAAPGCARRRGPARGGDCPGAGGEFCARRPSLRRAAGRDVSRRRSVPDTPHVASQRTVHHASAGGALAAPSNRRMGAHYHLPLSARAMDGGRGRLRPVHAHPARGYPARGRLRDWRELLQSRRRGSAAAPASGALRRAGSAFPAARRPAAGDVRA